MWLTRWQEGVDVMEEQAELIVQTVNLTAGRCVSKELLAHPQYQQLSSVTNNIYQELSKFHNSKVNTRSHFTPA